MNKAFILILGISFYTIKMNSQTVSDIDGNVYNTISLGSQIWMQENLKTIHFSNGDLIATTILAVNNDTSSIYQWMYNNDSLNLNTYGRLYTWFAVNDNRNICPSGWHVPNSNEWDSLAIFLGGDSIAGYKMKDTGLQYWLTTNAAVSNSSNFTGLPGGFRGNPSGFSNLGNMGTFWSATPWGSSAFQRAEIYQLKSNAGNLEKSVAVANCGFSIRCIKNSALSTEDIMQDNKVRIFPNPSSHILNISVEETAGYSLKIYDANGKTILSKQITEKTYKLDFNLFTKGIYFIKIENAGSVVEKKIIIE